MTVLVIAEHDNASVKPVTLSAITAANQLATNVKVLVAGNQCKPVIDYLKKIVGIEEILVADHPNYQYPLAESLAPLILHLCQTNISHLIAPATTFGKNLMPRVAAGLDVAQVSDVIEIIEQNTYRRPIYAGNAIITIRSNDPIQVLTVRPTAFAPAGVNDDLNSVSIVKTDFIVENKISQFIELKEQKTDRPELTSADMIVAIGRGAGDQATFDRIVKIADQMGAAVGASRAAVDAGLAPNDWQIGQTGKVVAPKLYFAVGISGAIQHLAGMKDSQVIVAINKDADAPIFQVANYGLVADLSEVLPQWESYLSNQ